MEKNDRALVKYHNVSSSSSGVKGESDVHPEMAKDVPRGKWFGVRLWFRIGKTILSRFGKDLFKNQTAGLEGEFGMHPNHINIIFNILYIF